jgi:hypothetical protein
MASNANLYISNDTQIDVTGLSNADDSSYLNTATVTATLKDASGAEVSGVSWPLTLSYETASDGNYSATIDKAISVVDGASYFLEITA